MFPSANEARKRETRPLPPIRAILRKQLRYRWLDGRIVRAPLEKFNSGNRAAQLFLIVPPDFRLFRAESDIRL